MIGLTAGAIAAGIVVALALQRPLLARMGTAQAFARPRQTVVVAVGLMFATVVLGASSIAADSTRTSFQEAILGRAANADLIFHDYATTPEAQDMDRLADQASLQGHIRTKTLALRAQLPFDDDRSGLGRNDATVWGIEPSGWRALTGLTGVAGSLPTSLSGWPEGGIVLTRALADALDAEVGDQTTLYVPGHIVPTTNTTVLQAHFTAAVANPLPQGPPFVNGPRDVFDFVLPVENVTYYEVAADTASVTLELSVAGPFGSVVNQTGGSHPRVSSPDYRRFGSSGVGDGTIHVTVNSPLAANTDITITVNVSSALETPATLLPGTVVAIAGEQGGDPLYGEPAVLLPLPRLQRAMDLEGRANVLLVATDGTRIEDDVLEQDIRSFSGIQVFAPKQRLQQQAAEVDLATRAFFLGMGSFTMAAGFMLVAVLLALLVEERKGMLGALRAVGAQRRDLTRLHLHEGAVYALLSSVAGLLGAAALAGILGSVAKDVLGEDNVPFHVVYDPATLLSVLGAGFTLTLIVIVVAAHRAVALDVPAALRGEEASPRGRRIWVPLLVTALGALLTLGGALAAQASLLVAGPVLLAFGASALLGRRVDRHLAISLGALAVAAYIGASFLVFKVDREEQAILLPVRGILLAVSLAILAAYSSIVHRGVVGLFGRVRHVGPVIETSLSHLRRRPGRAALTMAMLATVLTVMTALGTLFATVAPRDLGATGGFEVFGDTQASFTDAQAFYRANPPRSGVDPFPRLQGVLTLPWGANDVFRLDPPGANTTLRSRAWVHGDDALAMTPEAAQAFSYEATALAPGYATARDAFAAVASNPRYVALSSALQVHQRLSRDQQGLSDVYPGMLLSLRTGKDPPTLEVVAVIDGLGTAGAFVHPDVFALMEDSPGTRVYAQPAAGVTAQDAAKALEAGFRRAGMQALVVDDVDSEDQQVFHAMSTLVAVFLGLGIIVGMVSLALVTARNVMVRRREVGMLRAVGARQGQVLALFSIESLYLTGMAILVGFAVGLLMAQGALAGDDFVTFEVDWGALAVLYSLTLVAAFLTALLPAWRASRIPPAQAVRYVE
ncbi:MAG TPA: FtsX-like permease family protein [Candidatus Thermoplasmatota archaeon]|nr:FtsX-like permease family protein [Candidatus Thermoplasmatota archaeon]